MRNVCRHTLVLVVVALLLVPNFASAEVVITYDGETPAGITNSEFHTYDAIKLYPGGGAAMWDYVYILDPSDVHDGEDGGPWDWGIACPVRPELGSITYPDATVENYQWVGNWDNLVLGTDYGGVFDNTALEDQAAVIWRWTVPVSNPELFAPDSGTFTFQSATPPAYLPWVAVGDTGNYSGSGDEWSASPEPASMALYGLSLLGVGWWRRRKKTA